MGVQLVNKKTVETAPIERWTVQLVGGMSAIKSSTAAAILQFYPASFPWKTRPRTSSTLLLLDVSGFQVKEASFPGRSFEAVLDCIEAQKIPITLNPWIW